MSCFSVFGGGRLISLLAGVYALSSNDIRVGTNVEVDGAPWKVLGD
jgi:elongation factor P